ncbi:hypothetical protein [Halalkalibacter sp. APA_J-10(15)]|uniref:hypothetical protein n=1 Tax=Halalkalibacter sp. APA_J-10(15) TaxID=2933805 RepID=UPI001FF1D0F7|nr:hypothetical protein [Halalkalibacter sp. APA_J-10(15)]MCK0473053.1 hypothetical protein [Halalkalibacter sp. APA_J-10(15)]
MQHDHQYGHQPTHQPQHYHGMDQEAHKKQMYDTCNQYNLYFVQIQTTDGQMYDGIIDQVDPDGVTLLMPYGDMEGNVGYERQFGFGYGGFGHGFGFPRRFHRFRRFRFPFFGISRLFFPFFY